MSMKLVGLQGPRVADGPIATSPWIRTLPSPMPRLPAPIGGLVLDACNILYDDTAWRRWLLRLLTRLGLQTHYRCFFQVLDRDYLGDVHRGRRKFDEAMEAFLLSAGLSLGQIDEVKAACLSYRRSTENGLRLLTGVRDTLRRLHGTGLLLGVICNSEHPAADIRQRLDGLLWEPLLTAVVSSQDLGRIMPDPACYLAALGAMNLPAAQVAFVGHDPEELAGAAAVGMATIAFNCEPDTRADVHLQRFEDLLELIEQPPACAAAG